MLAGAIRVGENFARIQPRDSPCDFFRLDSKEPTVTLGAEGTLIRKMLGGEPQILLHNSLEKIQAWIYD